MDLGTEAFDAVLGRWSLIYVADVPGALTRLRRALVPGGRIAVAGWAPPEANPWVTIPMAALAFASALYIIGYSLADYHIAGLLMANPRLAERTVFIQGPDFARTFVRRTTQYGRTMFIGTDGFADALLRAPRPVVPSLDSLRSFRSLAPTRDKKTSARPTARGGHAGAAARRCCTNTWASSRSTCTSPS